jgi:S1-C subfamily serine protease
MVSRVPAVGSFLLMALFCTRVRSQSEQKLPDLIDSIRPAVVKIVVHIIPSARFPRAGSSLNLPAELQPCFNQTRYCILGTGFFVNSEGDVVTAMHVVDGYRSRDGRIFPGFIQIQDELKRAGIDSELEIGISIPNIEKPFSVTSGTVTYKASVFATKAEHDLAIIRADDNPFTHPPQFFGGSGAKDLPHPKPIFVKLAIERPRDAEEIFACGYPLGEAGLVTTSGTIGSAWNTQVLLRADAAGFGYQQEVYNVDLRINPGNSGGPVFRTSDSSVIGVAVQSLGSLGVVVPAKFVEAFLREQQRTWTAANLSASRKALSAARRVPSSLKDDTVQVYFGEPATVRGTVVRFNNDAEKVRLFADGAEGGRFDSKLLRRSAGQTFQEVPVHVRNVSGKVIENVSVAISSDKRVEPVTSGAVRKTERDLVYALPKIDSSGSESQEVTFVVNVLIGSNPYSDPSPILVTVSSPMTRSPHSEIMEYAFLPIF